ncbi:MAG: hypothetical protein F9K29_09460 [Hyphomicrobiaceae bacterium]|nr:MAG: hypothetical protein F9K29_09460 [Hyphomicrobiaceae bacterium]
MPKNYAVFEDALASVQRHAAGGSDEAAGRSSRPAVLTGIAHAIGFAAPVSADQACTSQDALAGLYAHDLKIDEGASHAWAHNQMTVADLLCLTPDLSQEDLHRLRREFALAHHPDRVPPSLREQSTRRMAEANILIDEALARAGHRRSSRSVPD